MIGPAEVCGVVVAALWIRPWRVRPRPLGTGEAGHRPRGRGSAPPETGDCASVPVSRRQRRASEREVVHRLPDVVDLTLLGVGAGLTPREALDRVRPWLPDPFAAVVVEALRRADAGEAFADALDNTTARLGPPLRPLVAALVAGEHDGVALTPALLRVGDEARRRRRVAAEVRARRLPVLMLGPLVLCVLPAFVLLTVTPLLLASLSDLRIP